MSVKEMIENILEDKLVESKELFSNILSDKVTDKINEAKKKLMKKSCSTDDCDEKEIEKSTCKEETDIDEVSSELLDKYKEKAKKSADDLYDKGEYRKSTDRWMNIMKATGKQIDKTTNNIKKALKTEDNEESVE